jgi:hypothetical protein
MPPLESDTIEWADRTTHVAAVTILVQLLPPLSVRHTSLRYALPVYPPATITDPLDNVSAPTSYLADHCAAVVTDLQLSPSSSERHTSLKVQQPPKSNSEPFVIATMLWRARVLHGAAPASKAWAKNTRKVTISFLPRL